MKGQIKDCSQPFIQIFAVLHEKTVMMHKILEKKKKKNQPNHVYQTFIHICLFSVCQNGLKLTSVPSLEFGLGQTISRY